MKPEIQRYKFKEEVKTGFEIVNLEAVYTQHKAQMTMPHRADFYHILWIEGGVSRHFVDFQEIAVEPFSLVFISKDAVHHFERTEEIKGKGIVFLDSFFCRSENDAHFLHSSVCFNNFNSVSKLKMNENSQELKEHFVLMIKEFCRAMEQHQSTYLRNLLHNFLILSERLLRQQEGFERLPTGIDLDYTSTFRNILNEHFKVQKTVGFYASSLNITENRLYHATQRILGKNPKQVINERLVLEAKRLLAHSDKPVKEICFDLGFEEPSNFNQFFKKYSGMTPNEFRSK
jgi:AraC-like DNA-binding protein